MLRNSSSWGSPNCWGSLNCWVAQTVVVVILVMGSPIDFLMEILTPKKLSRTFPFCLFASFRFRSSFSRSSVSVFLFLSKRSRLEFPSNNTLEIIVHLIAIKFISTYYLHHRNQSRNLVQLFVSPALLFRGFSKIRLEVENRKI